MIIKTNTMLSIIIVTPSYHALEYTEMPSILVRDGEF